MFAYALYKGGLVVSSPLRNGLLTSLAFLVLAPVLSADRLRGQLRHEFLDNIPVAGARIELADATDPTQTDVVESDALGYFVSTAFYAGDEVNVTATHPAYQQETPTVTLASDDHFESILMTPLGEVTTDYHNIIIQVAGAVAQLPLAGVPVEITRWSADNTLLSTDQVETDAKGVAVLRGARSGFYEFKLNDSSLPDTDRRARYEDYATPLLQRVEITQDHFMNVFLKPLEQDLKVRVTGYDFVKKEGDAPLENVLVEIRGLDPADHDIEVLHPRSDFTVLFDAGTAGGSGSGSSVDPTLFYLQNGEVVFQGLPPVAYEVKVSRFGYITQRILLEPDSVTGLLPNSYDVPLEVSLPAEGHAVDILVDFPHHVSATFDQNGLFAGSGVTGLGLKVRVVGIEGTNTDGLSYEAYTGQNLNGETYAPFYEPFLSGRYRVFVDGLSGETNFEYNETFDYYSPVGYDYDLASTGATIIEVPVGRTETTPEFHRFTVDLETPLVPIRGQLLAAESIEPDSRQPIFRPYTDQTIELVPGPAERNLADPSAAAVTVTTDAQGYFGAELLPGLYGIRLPGMDDYFGDEVIVHVGEATRPNNANRTTTYEWPLAEAFPEVPGAVSLQAHSYFELNGLPIHAGRDQFLELRVRREHYIIEAYGTENTDFNRKVVAVTGTGFPIEADYSPTLANQTTITLLGADGDVTTTIEPEPPGSFYNPLYARWDNLAPGDYTGVTATIPGHDFSAEYFGAKTLFDWPTPGSAPDLTQAALFDVVNFPNNEFPWEPLTPVQTGGFEIVMTPYEAATYSVYQWEERTVDGETVGEYVFQYDTSEGFMTETTVAPGYFGGYPSLGGPVTAIWSNGLDDQGNSYRVRLTPGGRLNLEGPSATPETAMPSLSYTLLIDGVAATDSATAINDVEYTLSNSGTTILTGTPLPGLTESPNVYKASSDNYSEQYQSSIRVLTDAASPTLGITVGLEPGMEVTATLRDQTPTGLSQTPIDIPAANLPVQIRNRYGRLLATETTDAEGKVTFNALPGYADYFLTVDAPGFTPVRRRLAAADATLSESLDTAATHDVTQDVVLLPRPTLHTTGVPHDRWGMFLPTVSRSGDVNAEDGIKTFDFFAAADALTTTWKVEVTPYQLNLTLPGFDNGLGTTPADDTLTGPDPIVAAYLIDERRFQKDGFSGGTDPLEGEELFAIPADDEPTDLAAIVKATTQIQSEQDGSFVSTSQQRRVFVDPADSIKIDATSGRTVVTGKMPLWDLPPGEFDPVIVLQTQRGAFLAYDVAYTGDDAPKRLRGPELPPWFANLLDLLGIASGIAGTQGRVQEALKDYVPEDKFIPLPDFSMTITVDKDDPEKEEGYLKYALKLGMSEEVGQESKAAGLLSYGPGFLGVKLEASAELATNGRENTTAFTLAASASKESLIDEDYGTKIAPIGGSKVSFEDPRGGVSTTASTNYPGGDDADPLKFQLTATAGAGVAAKVSANLNQYARPIPYAGPVIGILGDTGIASLDAAILGRIAASQTYTIKTEFPRSRKVSTRPRDEAVPRSSFLGETVTAETEFCLGVGFGTELTLSSQIGTQNFNVFSGNAKIAFDVGGGGCGVSDKLGTMEMKLNPLGGWPLITEISGEVSVKAEASAGAGLAQMKGEWTLAKADFKVQFGTETVVTHYPVQAVYSLSGDVAAGEGLFVDAGPEIVGGLAPAATFNVNGDLTDSFAFTTFDETSGQFVLRIAGRTGEHSWSDPLDIALAPQIGASTSLVLGDGRTLIVYATLVDGHDPYDPYADHQIFSRLIETDGTVGPQTSVAYLNNPVTQLALAQSGSRVELHTKAPATDGSQHYWQMFLTPFDPTTATWDSTQFRVNESEDFALSLTSGGPSGADEILLHWVTTSGTWKWLRSTDSTPQTVTGTFAAPPASWATASFYELVAPATDGRLLRFGQTALTGAPSERDTPLTTGRSTVEVGLTQQSVTAEGGYLLAWVEQVGSHRELFYLTYAPDGTPTIDPTPVTANTVGRYSDLRLTRQNATAAYIFARFDHNDVHNLRTFEIDLLDGLADNDADADGLPDPAELLIIDADTTDGIELIDQVLAGDDFDSDGFTNGEEILAGSDPANPFSTPAPPGPPVVSLVAIDAVAGEGLSGTASFTVQRTENLLADLPISLTYSGTSLLDTDYSTSPSAPTLAAGSASTEVTLTPLADDLAEGPETITVTLDPSADYELGTTTSLTLNLADLPIQQWRLDQFGAEANTTAAAATSDADGDGIINLLEYVFFLDPVSPDGPGGLELALAPLDGTTYLEIHYTRNPAATDVIATLEGSADLTTFTEVATEFTEVSTTTNPDGSETVVLRSTAPFQDLTARFFRLQLELMP
ncbi:carboxypeptidase-like regulatory domain-containing protein [Actomonas aquatica]|uniref:Carboxypeptidase-like regulatory domain-containing protein n=1 Tax=Actomonas aquatica TaxID=2866162 RepID=A0ABZ1CBP0_9BACT|nr:carboxypeptidase-like regulatory domain-containing protein [Opitutus sp. WL0086]WRQ88805.1 carboxypeptidase-like regulatory domain-containing protein [Opitutus sp. WL0086]